MTNVGFTGSQHAKMTRIQAFTVIEMLFELFDEGAQFHYGCCINRDDQAARIAKTFGYKLMGHPPRDKSKVGSVVNDFNYPELPYLERNHRIVDDTRLLIAAPITSYEVLRSGTWATVRFAVKRKKPGFVVYPDGEFSPLERTVSTARR